MSDGLDTGVSQLPMPDFRTTWFTYLVAVMALLGMILVPVARAIIRLGQVFKRD